MTSETMVVGDLLVPPALWLVMFIVGLDLTLDDFRRVGQFPVKVSVATISQIVAIPATAIMLITVQSVPAYMIAGLIILAASPAGALSNFFTYLGSGNVALSVTLTAVSGLISLAAMPFLIQLGFNILLDPIDRIPVPKTIIAVQLILFFLLPVVVGMIVRSRFNEVVLQNRNVATKVGLAILTFLICVILLENLGTLFDDFGIIFRTALLFSLIVMPIGWLTGWLLTMDRQDRLALVFEFGSRNFAVVAIVGGIVFKNQKLLLFPTIFFLVQVPLVALVLLSQRRYI